MMDSLSSSQMLYRTLLHSHQSSPVICQVKALRTKDHRVFQPGYPSLTYTATPTLAPRNAKVSVAPLDTEDTTHAPQFVLSPDKEPFQRNRRPRFNRSVRTAKVKLNLKIERMVNPLTLQVSEVDWHDGQSVHIFVLPITHSHVQLNLNQSCEVYLHSRDIGAWFMSRERITHYFQRFRAGVEKMRLRNCPGTYQGCPLVCLTLSGVKRLAFLRQQSNPDLTKFLITRVIPLMRRLSRNSDSGSSSGSTYSDISANHSDNDIGDDP